MSRRRGTATHANRKQVNGESGDRVPRRGRKFGKIVASR
jgi:hypothetical protein